MMTKRGIMSDVPSLSREQFCYLTELTVEEFKSYRKRNSLPFTPCGKHYSEMQAVLTCATKQLVDLGVRRANAAAIAGSAKNEILSRWREIALSLVSQHPPMLFGAFIRRREGRLAFVCTIEELGNLYRDLGKGGSLIVGSISEAAAGVELRRMQYQLRHGSAR